MSKDTIDVREKAAAAVAALARRAGSRARNPQAGAKPKPGQSIGPDGQPIDARKIREAIAYYDIAMSIYPEESYWPYLRALQVEALGEYGDAAAAFRAIRGQYAPAGKEGAARCERRAKGEPEPWETALDDAFAGGGAVDIDQQMAQLQDYIANVKKGLGHR